jgi:ribulose-5-phosphate 4-epimerase/fuculose-1-phosphate aldolase
MLLSAPLVTREGCIMTYISTSRLLATAAVGIVALAAAAQATGGQAPQGSIPGVDPGLIEDLVSAYRILADQGVLDTYGHVSVRHPTVPDHYLMARSVAPADVAANDIMEYDADSNPIDARGRASVLERFIHGEVYRAHPNVKAIVHSHSPGVVPFSVTSVPLRPLYHMASFLWVGVPVWDIRAVKDPTAPGLLVRNIPVGKSLAAALGDKPVMLMRGHGNVVVASSVQQAVTYAIWTEVNARLQLAAMQLGGPITFITAEEGEALDKNPGDLNRGWQAWKKKALGK